MTNPSPKQRMVRVIIGVVVMALCIGGGWAAYQYRQAHQSEPSASTTETAAERKNHSLDSLDLTPETVKAIHLNTIAATVPRFSKKLHLRGSLAIDPNRLSHVHARFPGTIVDLATVEGLRSQEALASGSAPRTLQGFDKVEQGVPLAIIWSKDLGEKKSQLASSLAELRKEKQTLKRYEALQRSGSISDREFMDQQLKVEQGQIATFTAEATLRSYQVSEAEIVQVKESAEKIHLSQETDKSYSADWPRVIVRAPISGSIVEKTVTIGDIVDAYADLFKIADMSVLAVYLHAYEEDLPALEQLPKPLQVSIKILANPEKGELRGQIDRFSPLVDQNEHMALLIGTVENPKLELLSGQLITADVGIPAEPGIVEIPANALVDSDSGPVVFVQPDTSKPNFQRRQVKVVKRYFDVVYVRSEISEEQKQAGLREIHVGDAVIAGGILELEDYFQQQR